MMVTISAEKSQALLALWLLVKGAQTQGWCARRDSNARPSAPENDAQFLEK